MKIKHRFSDFRVTEVLRPGLVQKKGPFSVYRVTKRKLSTHEAVEELAHLCDVEPSDVSVAGLKDRQGITIQHMTVPGRRPLKTKRPDLRIEHIGFAEQELSSTDSQGNSFEITVRAVESHELAIFKKNIAPVREFGVPNYFDEQRFGNLRHGQGWIARDLMLGQYEEGLKNLLTAPSPFDDDKNKAFKSAMHRNWGDWRACRDIAGKFGAHHSIFEHLGGNPSDFAGAFFRVATRLRLIHLYAFQSHVWNRAVAERIRECVESDSRVRVPSVEGPLVFFDGEPPLKLIDGGVPLPGASLEGVEGEETRALFERVLAAEGLTVENFRIDGVPGFQLKPEDRALVVLPKHLRVRPAVPDADHPGLSAVVLRFELPRGSYATLVVKRLFARSRDARSRAESGHAENMGSALKAAERKGQKTAGHYSGPGGRSGGSRDSGGDRPQRPYEHKHSSDRGGSDRRQGAYARGQSGGYRGGDRDRQSSGHGGNRPNQGGERSYNDSRGGGGQRGGYGSRDQGERGGGYRQGGSQDRGSYGGDRRGGDQRGSYGNDNRGGAPNRERSGSGPWRGSDNRGGDSRGGDNRGGYRGGDNRSGGQRGGSYGDRGRPQSGGYGGRRDDSRGGYGGQNRGGSGSGYQGRGSSGHGGGAWGGQGRSSGGYDSRGQGGQQGGYGQRSGGGSSYGGDRDSRGGSGGQGRPYTRGGGDSSRDNRGGGAWSGGGSKPRYDSRGQGDQRGGQGGSYRGHQGSSDRSQGGGYGGGRSSGGYGGGQGGGQGGARGGQGGGAWKTDKRSGGGSSYGKSFHQSSSGGHRSDDRQTSGGGWKDKPESKPKPASANPWADGNPWEKAKRASKSGGKPEQHKDTTANPSKKGEE